MKNFGSGSKISRASQIPSRLVEIVCECHIWCVVVVFFLVAGVPQRSRRRTILQRDLRPILPARRWELTIAKETAALPVAVPLHWADGCVEESTTTSGLALQFRYRPPPSLGLDWQLITRIDWGFPPGASIHRSFSSFYFCPAHQDRSLLYIYPQPTHAIRPSYRSTMKLVVLLRDSVCPPFQHLFLA